MIHYDMPMSDYRALPGTSSTELNRIRTSPHLYRWCQQHGRPDTAPMAFGRAAHVAVLEPARFRAQYLAYDGVRRGKKYDAFRAEHPGCTVLTAKQHMQVSAVARAVNQHGPAAALLEDMHATELSIEWTEPQTGERCKSRLDLLTRGGIIVDLKNTADIEPHRFASTVIRFGIDLQSAFYFDAARYAGLRPVEYRLIAAQPKPPYDVAVYRVPASVLDYGRRRYRDALATLQGCRVANQWPGLVPGVADLELPAWIEAEDAEEIDWDSLEEVA